MSMINNSNQNEIDINIKMEENELYYYLLEDIYATLDQHISDESGIKISKPDVTYDVSRKSIWSNFTHISKQINRNKPEDILLILKFFKKEFSVNPSVNKDGHFLIRGRYTSQMITNILKRYIKIFLKCEPCKGMNTVVEKRQNRLIYLVCLNDKCKYEKVINYDF